MRFQCWKNSILTFCHSDYSSSIGSNCSRLVDGSINGILEKHDGRVWNVITIDEKHSLHRQSDVVEFHINQFPGFSVPSRSFFHKCSYPFFRNPATQSCVDTIASRQLDYMQAISECIRKKSTYEELKDEKWIKLLNGCTEYLVEKLC